VGAATQIYYSAFDTAFLKLPKALHDRIEAKLDNMGRQLDQFPHHRLVGSQRFRLRVGDYRIIYASTFPPTSCTCCLSGIAVRFIVDDICHSVR
jgi:hypothetical protein